MGAWAARRMNSLQRTHEIRLRGLEGWEVRAGLVDVAGVDGPVVVFTHGALRFPEPVGEGRHRVSPAAISITREDAGGHTPVRTGEGVRRRVGCPGRAANEFAATNTRNPPSRIGRLGGQGGGWWTWRGWMGPLAVFTHCALRFPEPVGEGRHCVFPAAISITREDACGHTPVRTGERVRRRVGCMGRVANEFAATNTRNPPSRIGRLGGGGGAGGRGGGGWVPWSYSRPAPSASRNPSAKADIAFSQPRF